MAPQEIRKALTERPFMPFRLHISDGSTFDVLDSADAYVDLLAVLVGTDPDDESGLFRKRVRISPNHVTRIEPLPERQAKPSKPFVVEPA